MTIKRSPIVLIRNFILIEAIASVLYFIATGLDEYKYQIYALSFKNFLTYETTRLFVLSGVQLGITIYAFLRWYYESYTIQSGMVSYMRGVFFKKEKKFSLEKSITTTVSSGPLGNLLHYGSIRLENHHHSSIVLRTISRPQIYLRIIERNIDSTNRRFTEKPDIARLIDQNEHEQLEFKASLRFDRKIGQLNRDLEKSAMKTIAAFLNSKGGYLVIGVDNDRKPLGLSVDYGTLQHPNSDGFEIHFTQVFNSMIGPEFRGFVKLWFQKLNDNEICIIQAAPSTRPIYLKVNDSEHFFVRTGNTTTTLKFSEVESYTRSRWPKNK